MENEKCPCCPNHCEKDNLSCGKGREYFNNSKINQEKPISLEETVIMDLRKCESLLHHKKYLNEKELLSSFSLEELENLHIYLSKIYSKVGEK